MKKLLPLFFIIFSFQVFGQTKTQPKAAAENSTKAKQVANYLAITETEKKLQFCSQPQIVSHPDCDGKDYAQELNNLYKAMLSDEIGTQLLFAKIMTDYQKLKMASQSAPQATQAAGESAAKMQMVIMLQNEKIIDLLEKLVNKK